MKIDVEETGIIIYLKKEELDGCNFDDIDEIEEYFRSLFLRLQEYYHITLEGFYNIHVYLDKNEGMVLKMEEEDIDYYSHFHQLEMRIIKEEVVFLYEVEDIFPFVSPKNEIYTYKNHFYLRKKGKEEVYNLYELGKLVYENTDIILKKGTLLTEK